MFLDWQHVNAADVQKILKAVKNHLSNKNTWTDYGIAFNKNGTPVLSNDKNAVIFSLMGCIEYHSRRLYAKPLSDFVDCATRDFLSNLSDHKAWKEFMSYYDELSLLRLAINEIQKYT
jgi:hypothetical protein